MKEPIVLFDVGKTLIDSEAIIKTALDCTIKGLKQAGFVEDDKEFRAAYLQANESTTFQHINHTYSDFWIIRKAWRSLGFSDDYRLYANFLFEYRNHVRANIRPDPLIVKVFQRLRNRDVLLGVASDGTIVEQLETIMRLGIVPYLKSDLIFVSEEIGVEKTDGGFYECVLEKTKRLDRRVVIVGDRLDADVSIPKEFGVITVLLVKYVKYPQGKIRRASPNFVINDLAKIESLIDSF